MTKNIKRVLSDVFTDDAVIDKVDVLTSDECTRIRGHPIDGYELMAEQEYEGEVINILREYVLKEGVIR